MDKPWTLIKLRKYDYPNWYIRIELLNPAWVGTPCIICLMCFALILVLICVSSYIVCFCMFMKITIPSNLLVHFEIMMRALIPLLLYVSLISGKYLLVETDSDEEVN